MCGAGAGAGAGGGVKKVVVKWTWWYWWRSGDGVLVFARVICCLLIVATNVLL